MAEEVDDCILWTYLILEQIARASYGSCLELHGSRCSQMMLQETSLLDYEIEPW